MRRMSFNRPNEKVRNPNRHLRSLEKWASNFDGYYPARSKERYINFKIRTLDRLIEGPTSKFEWQQVALNQLLITAKNLIDSKPETEKGKSWVAVLLCYPNLWSSEVTVFFDKSITTVLFLKLIKSLIEVLLLNLTLSYQMIFLNLAITFHGKMKMRMEIYIQLMKSVGQLGNKHYNKLLHRKNYSLALLFFR